MCVKKNKIEMERGKEGDRQRKREREVERVRKIDFGTGGLNLWEDYQNEPCSILEVHVKKAISPRVKVRKVSIVVGKDWLEGKV